MAGGKLSRRGVARQPKAHFLVPGLVKGWYVCMCGCGAVSACPHCVPGVDVRVPVCWCDAEQQRRGITRYGFTSS